jgi:hypothetical protein
MLQDVLVVKPSRPGPMVERRLEAIKWANGVYAAFCVPRTASDNY